MDSKYAAILTSLSSTFKFQVSHLSSWLRTLYLPLRSSSKSRWNGRAKSRWLPMAYTKEEPPRGGTGVSGNQNVKKPQEKIKGHQDTQIWGYQITSNNYNYSVSWNFVDFKFHGFFPCFSSGRLFFSKTSPSSKWLFVSNGARPKSECQSVAPSPQYRQNLEAHVWLACLGIVLSLFRTHFPHVQLILGT